MTERVDIRELEEFIDMELWLDQEGLDYRVTMGSSGEQLNLKECPRCGGAEYKVYLNRETGLGNCFHGSCVGERGFTKFNFINHYLGEGFAKAIEHVKTFARESGWRTKRKVAAATSNDVYDVKLPESVELPDKLGRNLDYLTARGLDDDSTRYFNLRYSQQGTYGYVLNGEEKRQDHSERVIIPIYNLDGELVTFQGRDVSGEKDRKYLFPPGLAGTGRFLYNGHNAVGKKRVIVGEGAFDVFALKRAMDGEPQLRDVEAIGTFGKSLSKSTDGESQYAAFARLKREGLEEVTFMWDGELSTIVAATKAALEIAAIGLTVKVAMLPKDKDPDEVAPQVVRDAYYSATIATRAKLTRLVLTARRVYSRTS